MENIIKVGGESYKSVSETQGCVGCAFRMDGSGFCDTRDATCARDRVIYVKCDVLTQELPKYTFDEFVSAYNTAFMVLGTTDTEKLRKQLVSQTDSEYSEFVRLTEKFKNI